VNQAGSARQARGIIERLEQTARVFLQKEVSSAGYVLYDPSVIDAVIRRTPFVISNPGGPAAQSMTLLARRVRNLTQFRTARGEFFPRICERTLEYAS
jgi:MinD-like ATPase involved in chromosome partitioning or flagellar assembly